MIYESALFCTLGVQILARKSKLYDNILHYCESNIEQALNEIYLIVFLSLCLYVVCTNFY